MDKLKYIILTGLFLSAWFSSDAQNIIYPDDARVVDITKEPYFADNTGATDITAILQQAVNEHTPGGSYIIYFPNGTYLISDEIRWGDDAWNQGPAFEGQYKDSTIIKLSDNNPLYQDPVRSKALIWTGDGSADNFRNEIRNLTIHTGSGNPGASGIKFNSNNMGTIKNVDIISGDGTGVIGLDMAYTDMIGPLLIHGVYVNGFNVGVKTGGGAVNSMTLEDVTVENQLVTGFVNGGQVVSIRNLTSINAVPAVRNYGGDMVLIDSKIEGTEGASTLTAIYNNSRCFLRNIEVTGYELAFDNNSGPQQKISGKYIAEQVSHEPLSLFENPGLSLNLPIKEIPEVEWEQDLNNWVNVEDFGAVADDGLDDSEAIREAVNQNKSTVYLPNGKYRIDQMVEVTGNVSRIIGTSAIIEGSGGFELKEGTAPVVIIERLRRTAPNSLFNIRHSSSRTLIISNFSTRIVSEGTGDLFLNDVVGGPHNFNSPGQNIWCRQLDTEQGGHSKGGDYINVQNHGARLWILGYKTENANIKILTDSGGKTEVLGHFLYALGSPKVTPIYKVTDASLSVAGMRQSYFSSGIPYQEFVSETRNGVTKILYKDQTVHNNAMPLFVGHDNSQADPVVYYPLNETEGSLAYDSSANAFNAQLQGTITDNWNPDSGSYSGALKFNGDNNYLLFAEKESEGGSKPIFHDAFSTQLLSLWFKPQDITETQYLYSRGSNTNGYAVKIENGKVIAGFVHNNNLQTLAGMDITEDQWNHLAVSFDNGEAGLFLNGKLVTSLQMEFSTISSDGNAAVAGAAISADPFNSETGGTGDYFFNGWLDEVKIFDSIPDRRFVEKLAWFPPREVSEVYFSMENMEGTILSEDLGTGYNATMYGIGFETEGISGHGLNFNGITNWVELWEKRLGQDLNDFYQGAYSERTVMFWFKPVNTSSRQLLFSAGRLNGTGIMIYEDSLKSRINYTGGDTTYSFDLNYPLGQPNEWYQVALVFDRGEISLFINGIRATSLSSGIDMIKEDPESVELGAQSDVGPFGTGGWEQQQYLYTGVIDEFRMYKSALGVEEILNDYNRLLSDKPSSVSFGRLLLYPNPASDRISISLPEGNENINYSIIDINGRVIMEGKISGSGNQFELPVSSMKIGLYILKIETERNNYIERFIIN